MNNEINALERGLKMSRLSKNTLIMLLILLIPAIVMISGCSTGTSSGGSSGAPAPDPEPTEAPPIYQDAITNPGGEPVVGAVVKVKLFDSEEILKATTDDQGVFRIQAEESNIERISIFHPEFRNYYDKNEQEEEPEADRDLKAGGIVMDPLLPGYGVVTGAVTDSATGLPLAGVEVKIFEYSDFTAADGTYSISGVPKGSNQVIIAELSGYQDYANNDVNIEVDESQITYDFTMTPNPPDTGDIWGVIRPWGIRDVEVTIAGQTVTSTIWWFIPLYEMQDIPAGWRLIRATKDGYHDYLNYVLIEAGVEVRHDFTMAPISNYDVSGRVRDSITGRNISGAEVRIIDNVDTTGNNGRYSLNNVENGVHVISATKEGYYDYFATIDVNGDLTHDINMAPLPKNAYVTNILDNTISVININTNTVDETLDIGEGPTSLVFSKDGNSLYVVIQGEAKVSVFKTSDNSLLTDIPVGNFPEGISLSPDGEYIFVANKGSNTVSVIQTSDNTVVRTLDVGTTPYDTEVTPDGNYLYVTNQGDDTATVYQTSDYSLVATVNVGRNPTYVEAKKDGSEVYVSNLNDSNVTIIRTSDHTATGTIPVGFIAAGITMSNDGSRAYVMSIADNGITVINTADNTVTDTITAGNGPWYGAIDKDGSYMYVTNQWNDTVSVINLSTNTEETTIPVGFNPWGIAITPW